VRAVALLRQVPQVRQRVGAVRVEPHEARQQRARHARAHTCARARRLASAQAPTLAGAGAAGSPQAVGG